MFISWIMLLIAGIFEVVWALGLQFSQGFTKFLPSLITFIFLVLSTYFLALATRTIPIGIAYTVWVGIGAVGAFLGSVILFEQKTNVPQMLFFSIIIIGLIGLKITSMKI